MALGCFQPLKAVIGDACLSFYSGKTDRETAPSNLIGANGFAVEGRSLGWRLRHPEGRDRRERPRRRSSTAKESPAPLDGPPALTGCARCRRLT